MNTGPSRQPFRSGARSVMSLYRTEAAPYKSARERGVAGPSQAAISEAAQAWLETSVPMPPCPKCGEPTVFRSKLQRGLDIDPDACAIVGCRACRVSAACVPGIQNMWRCNDDPELAEHLIRDAEAGIRQRHMLGSDASDPMWTAF